MRTPARLLVDHLETLRQVPGWPQTLCEMAEAIIADPQAHVDALVAAGVLHVSVWCPVNLTAVDEAQSFCRYAQHHVKRYSVVAPESPHVHDWYFTRIEWSSREAYWACRSCPNTATTDIVPPS